MLTLPFLRFYYLMLVGADQALWSFTPLALAVTPWAVLLADAARVTLLVLVLLPKRFRLAQVRALRGVSLWAFAEGACAAWSARSGLLGEDTWWLVVTSSAACRAAYWLAAGCVAVLMVNALLAPRTRYL